MDGGTEDIMALEPIPDKWRSFGWSVVEIDGHNMGEVVKALENVHITGEKPTAIIAHTTKGKGISFMENQVSWHYRAPTPEEAVKALEELDARERKEGR